MSYKKSKEKNKEMEADKKSITGGSTLSKLKTYKFSRPQLVIFILAFALIGYLIFRTFASSPLIASLEGEQMALPAGSTVISDTNASGGKAAELTAPGTASGSVTFASSVTSFSVVARGDQCKGAPQINVLVDGTKYLSKTSVSSTSWSTYTATPSPALTAGTHTLTITSNNLGSIQKGKQPGCARNLYLDVSNFYGQSVTPTPPTVSLSASPTAVNAGQASTLTWSSTNANTCAGTGAWNNASLATSGSQSTGALNQTSTFNLSCTGDGGTATASTTVTVSSSTTGPPPAPTVYINPLTQTYTQGSTITVEVHENSGSTGVNTVQANFSYPTNLLTFVSIDGSTSPFTVQAQSTGGNGTVSIARGVIGSLTGDQVVATVTFTVNSTPGTAKLAFTTGTALYSSSNSSDILGSLAATGTSTYTIQ